MLAVEWRGNRIARVDSESEKELRDKLRENIWKFARIFNYHAYRVNGTVYVIHETAPLFSLLNGNEQEIDTATIGLQQIIDAMERIEFLSVLRICFPNVVVDDEGVAAKL